MVSNIPGMPTGSRIEREDEIWAVVAFLTQIQKLDAKAYRDLALGNVHRPKQAVPSLRHSSSSPGRLRLAPGATAMKANGR